MPQSENHLQGLLNAAGLALSDGAAHVAGFADHEEFRRALVKSLEAHPAFINAVRDFHGQATAAAPGAKGQTPRRIVPSGRVQAPRHDSNPRG